ncbi:MAG: L-histidine N(alpha)-methyltransferase [Nitrospiria bacterium]
MRGLSARVKRLPCKLFYDARGSELFEAICETPEYYVTRTEQRILTRYAEKIAERIGPHARIVEFGSGNSAKTRVLLDHLDRPAAYIPVDISQSQLAAASLALARAYPQVEILPLCADYTGLVAIPQASRPVSKTIVFFPGSTIGNFTPEEARHFLARIARLCGPSGGLLIGVDLKKDRAVLEPAYADREGVTAAFNLNLLHRVNRELGGELPVERFRHRAHYNSRHGRIEMHLVARGPISGRVGRTAIRLAAGEHITTEYSYKYRPAEFARLAEEAGFQVVQRWSDERSLFSIQYLTVRERQPADVGEAA